jgi:hypothetical protein
MVLETLVFSPLSQLTRLVAREYRILLHLNPVLRAGSIWPDCRLKTNLFCWSRQSSRQSGVVERQLGSRIGFNAATAVKEKVIDIYFLVWCMPRQCWFAVLCRFWLQYSHGLRPRGHRDRHTIQTANIISLLQYFAARCLSSILSLLLHGSASGCNCGLHKPTG